MSSNYVQLDPCRLQVGIERINGLHPSLSKGLAIAAEFERAQGERKWKGTKHGLLDRGDRL